MIEKMKLLSIILLIVVTTSQVSACSTEKYASSSGVNEAIKTLQQKVPFTIITPTYFPEGIVTEPSIVTGPDKGQLSKNSVVILIKYWQPKSLNQIVIFEENFESNWSLSSDSNIVKLSGTAIVEEQADPIDATESQYGYLYTWNSNGINYLVTIYGYGKEECRKVIDSMINQ